MPHLSRRRSLLAATAVIGSGGRPAFAQPDARPWPVRQTRLVVPFTAGGSLDIPARIIAERMSRRHGVAFVVDSKPGAGGGIGTMEVVRAPNDGGTLLVAASSIAFQAMMQPRLGFDPERDLVPVSLLVDMPGALVVRSSSPIRDLDDLLAKAKAQPGRYTYGSGGVGSAIHFAAALFNMRAGIELLHVPYGGFARVMTALLAGEVDVGFSATVDLIPAARQGSVRILAVSTPQRLAALPDVPAAAERVPGFDILFWSALFAPRGTSPEFVTRLAAELVPLRSDPDLVARLAEGASIIRFDGPDALASRLSQDMARWNEVIVRENIRPD
jgi:tripartite-type tricarboxylate transporter receptor subunit TctC